MFYISCLENDQAAWQGLVDPQPDGLGRKVSVECLVSLAILYETAF